MFGRSLHAYVLCLGITASGFKLVTELI
jgi:hypothetical protein